MTYTEAKHILQSLRNLTAEIEITEFKEAKTGYDFAKLGKYFSALSNEANLKGRPYAWLGFGLENKRHNIVDSQFRPQRKDLDSLKRKIANKTTNRIKFIEIYELNEPEGREAVLNAIAHRDYTITSEAVVKQYPHKIIITNPGGFPKGVTIENILTVSSTPRSRLMTEILEKTGLAERSGQGVDKLFSITLSEGKAEPDYKNWDMFQVSLILRTEIIDKAFHVFVSQYQNSEKEPKLGVE